MVFTAGCDTPVQNTVVDERPNILLIVADDLGYADLGVFGSDINTPNIDALAAQGILFTQFHTAVMCAPTRAMLMSGNNNHVAGMARQGRYGILSEDYPGYEAHLSDRIIPFPQLLLAGGYHTYMVGKWHLGDEVEHGPGVAGFERSYPILLHVVTKKGKGYEFAEKAADRGHADVRRVQHQRSIALVRLGHGEVRGPDPRARAGRTP